MQDDSPEKSSIQEGHYFRKQMGCKSSIIAWSHGARFKMALKLVGSNPQGQLLDYGFGDGTFMALCAQHFAQCFGAEINEHQVSECRARLSHISNLHFHSVAQLSAPEYSHRFDVVTCMETLEHCPDPVVEIVLNDLERLCHPSGRIVISVPIETGATFLGKFAVRKVAAWRGLSDYKYYENYSVPHAAKMLFATRHTQIKRPVYGNPGSEFHSHYAFNWRRLRMRVARQFKLERTFYSPLNALGGIVSSQAWFVCRPKG